MDSIIEAIEDWFRGLLVSGIMSNVTNTFSSLNHQVGEIATEVGRTPASFSPTIFNMIRNLSENVIMPIAGILLTFIACYELIQLVIGHNNLANFETWIFWKWIFKTFLAVTLITNTMNITMAVFDVAQHVVNNAGGIIAGSTAIDDSALATMESSFIHRNISEEEAYEKTKVTYNILDYPVRKKQVAIRKLQKGVEKITNLIMEERLRNITSRNDDYAWVDYVNKQITNNVKLLSLRKLILSALTRWRHLLSIY